MLSKVRGLIGAAVIILSVPVFNGCIGLVVGAAAGAGGVAYVQGVLSKNLDTPIDKLHRLSLDALKRLKMTIKEEKVDGLVSSIKAQDVDRSKIKITIEKLTENSSKINIRVGVFGNKTKSQMILNAILRKL